MMLTIKQETKEAGQTLSVSREVFVQLIEAGWTPAFNGYWRDPINRASLYPIKSAVEMMQERIADSCRERLQEE